MAAAAISAPLANSFGGTVGGAVGGEFGKTAGLIAGSLAYGFSHQAVTTALAGGKVTAANVASDAFGNYLAAAQVQQTTQAGNGQQTATLDRAYAADNRVSLVAPVDYNPGLAFVENALQQYGSPQVGDTGLRASALVSVNRPGSTRHFQAG